MKWLILLLLVGCSHAKKQQTTVQDLDTLRLKRLNYLEWSRPLLDKDGFVSVDKCDGLLWTCLRYVGGAGGNYHAAEGVPGQWFRDSAHGCGPANGSSQSTISNDMLLGLALCAWQAGDAATANQVVAYSDAHGGVMGDGPASDTQMSPLVYSLFKSVAAKVSGAAMPPRQDASAGLSLDVLTGYRAHLMVLGVLIDGLAYGGLTSTELAAIKDQASRQPRNALYQAVYHRYTDGDQTSALSTLFDESLFPKDRLPSSTDRGASYLWQRDYPSTDWSSDPSNNMTWDGTDLIFATAVIGDELRGDKVQAD